MTIAHPAVDTGPPIAWPEVRSVLVVRVDNLGDVVMATPVLRALRAFLPNARLDLLASPAGAAATPMLPHVDQVRVLSPSWQRIGAAQPDDIDLTGYDVMIVLTSERQSPWPAAYLGFQAGIGVRAVHSVEFGGAVATHWVSPPGDAHQVDRGLHLVAALGVPTRGTHLELDLTSPTAGGYALVVPGASCSSKRYQRFGEVAARIAAAGMPVLVAGTPKEEALVADVLGPGVRALPPTDAVGFASAIAGAQVVLCNNSAAMHIADAVGTPVVVTYAGTERTTDMPPRHVPHSLLGQPVACSPCRQFTCPYQHECLDIPPARVATAALRLAHAGKPAERRLSG